MLAGIIPTYSIQDNGSEYIFSANQRVSPEINVLDYALFTCSMVCHMIILICKPEQLPYLKHRYGDVFINHYDSTKAIIKYENDRNSNPIPIYYIPVATKYRKHKVDTEVFNIFHIADCFFKAMKEVFALKEPRSLFIVFPYIVVHPNEFMEKDKAKYYHFKEMLYKIAMQAKLQHEITSFRFGLSKGFDKDTEDFPNNSHCMITMKTAMEIFNKLSTLYQDYRHNKTDKEELLKLTLRDVAGEFFDHNPHRFLVSREHFFDLRKWSEYLRLQQFIESRKGIYIQYAAHWMCKQTIKLQNLTYDFAEPIIEDTDPYCIKPAQSIKNRQYESWKIRRDRLRKQHGSKPNSPK